MRKAAIWLMVILGSWVAALAQAPVHQWKVVQEVQLTQQTLTTPETTLFTPTKAGLYRVNLAIACGGPIGNSQAPAWDLDVGWIVGDSQAQCAAGASTGNVIAINPRPGAPVTYEVVPLGGPPTFAYDVDIIVEQFQ
jgi:hypothetical protein